MTLKILFLTTTSAYTGSEIVLSNIIHNINYSSIKTVAWISFFKGELLEKIEKKQIPYLAIKESVKFPWFWLFLIPSILKNNRYFSSPKSLYINTALSYIYKKFKSDIWYINTISQPEALEYAYLNKIPCVVHVHELEQMLIGLTDQEIEILINYPKLIIACSQTSAQMLKTLGRTENIEICYPTIDIKKMSNLKLNAKDLREKLGISQSTFIWCMSGSADPNKNPVRFIEIAHQLLEQNYDCHFLWLGNNPHSGLSIFAQKYATSLNINHKITWAGILRDDNYYNHLNLANAFVLTSSKESFSIVSLEALYLKKPILSFDCGGIREIVTDKLGQIIDSWNTSDIVEAMIKVMNNDFSFDPELARATAEKYAIEIQVNKWEKIMTSYFI